jgi:hypothetical protein
MRFRARIKIKRLENRERRLVRGVMREEGRERWVNLKVMAVMRMRMRGRPADWRSEGEENMVLATAKRR